MTDRRVVAVGIASVLLFVVVYGTAAGHGFIKDDYAWVLHSRAADPAGLLALFRQDNGFYRPIVALTFAVDAWLFGPAPLGYGLTNVLLAVLCGLAIARLARALGLPPGAAALAGVLWLLNPHLRAAVLWTSGRTALVLTLAAVLSAAALARGRLIAALVWLVIALFSKEEAVVLPFVLLGWLWLLTPRGARPPVRPAAWAAGCVAVAGIYLWARASTAAMTPWTAPPFYRFTFDPAIVVNHLIAYADRAMTFPAIVTLLAALMLGWSRPLLDGRTRRVVACGAVWLAGGYALTLFVPAKSDVYAALPSAGVSLAAAAVCGRLWQASTPPRQSRALVTAVALLVALAPVLYLRTRGHVREAAFAGATLADLRDLTAPLPDGASVVLQDARGEKDYLLRAAFGTLLEDAFEVAAGRRLRFWIEPPPPDAALAGLTPPCPTCVAMRLAVAGGRLQRRE